MANETILQHWVFREFILPFLLIFALTFAILERTKMFGSDKKQVNAIISAVIGLIFVSVVYPKLVVENLILFLSVALVVIFVFLMIYGFISGNDSGIKFDNKGLKIFFGILAGVVVLGALLWAMGLGENIIQNLFDQPWSNTFWTNFIFVVVIAGAIALILRKGK